MPANEAIAAIEKIGAAFDSFQKESNKALAENRERIEHLEARACRIGKPGSPGGEKSEHVKLFEAWMRRPRDPSACQELANYENYKAVTIGSNAGGGFAVPEEIFAQLERHELKLSPVRNLVKVVRSNSSDFKHLLTLRTGSAGWVGESDARSETNTPTLREIVPTQGELYCYPQCSEWSLDDVFFSVSDWLAAEAAEQFALLEGDAVIRGSGVNRPTGMLNTAPVSTDDSAVVPRNQAAYQFILSGDNSPAAIDADSLIDLQFTLNARYRAGATWIMNSATAGQVRKLKDTTNQYLWQPGLVNGQPDRLLGSPVSIWEQLDDVGGGKLPVAYGDWSRAYLLVDRSDVRITVDNNITTPGKVKFFIRRREGGIVLNNDAAKWLKLL